MGCIIKRVRGFQMNLLSDVHCNIRNVLGPYLVLQLTAAHQSLYYSTYLPSSNYI